MLRENHVVCDPLGVGTADHDFVHNPTSGTWIIKTERLVIYRGNDGSIRFGFVRVRDLATRMLWVAIHSRNYHPQNPNPLTRVPFENLRWVSIPFSQPRLQILTPGC